MLAAGATGALAEDALRVYAIRPGCFEYCFASVVSLADSTPQLAFNDLDGRTHVVRVGEQLGAYQVRAFTPETIRTFNPSLNAYQEKRGGTVALAATNGTVQLKLGDPLELADRWMGCLVSLASGDWRYLRAGQAGVVGGTRVRVTAVGPDSLRAEWDGVERTVPPVSDDERKALQRRWDDERKAAEALAQAEQRQAAAVAVAQTEVKPKRVLKQTHVYEPAPSGLGMGTEYRYPTEFEVYSVMVPDGKGGVRVQAIAVPRRFESRRVGTYVRQQ